MHAGADSACDGDRDEGPSPELEEQELNHQEDRGDRSAERGGHARGRAAGEEGPSFARGQPEELAEYASHSPSGLDDRALRPEWTTGADRDRGGDRFE